MLTCDISKDDAGLNNTHKTPTAKIPIVKSFFFKGICSFQRGGIGINRSAKSEILLKAPVALKPLSQLKQWPPVRSLFKNFSGEPQANIA